MARSAVCPTCTSPFQARRSNHRYCSRPCSRAAQVRPARAANVLTITEAAYLAGMIDADGHVILAEKAGRVVPIVGITSTNGALLQWVHRTLGVGGVYDQHPETDRRKASGGWQLRGAGTVSVLAQVAPYMLVKAEQAQIVLEFVARRAIPREALDDAWQREARERVRLLNQRGPLLQG